MLWASLLPRQFVSNSCPGIIYADCPILQKGCHYIVNIEKNECCHDVVEMFSDNFLRQRFGNVRNLIFQRFHNFPPTLWKRCGNHILPAE